MPQNFIRARGEEQKAVRIDQIVDAALELYAEVGYDRLTFSKLAQGLGFSRINLYNYFKTKEDLFLEIVRRAFDDLAADALSALPPEPTERDAYISAWTEVVARQAQAIELFVLLNTQVLRGVDSEAAERFQTYLDGMVTSVADRVATCLGLSPTEAWDLVAHQLNYAMGLWPIVSRRHGYDEGARAAFAKRYRQFMGLVTPRG